MNILRLHRAVAFVCPKIHGISVGEWGNPLSVRIDFFQDATPLERTQAENAVRSFDWSQAAEDDWVQAQDKATARGGLQGGSPEFRLLRAILKDSVAQRQVMQSKINEVVARINSATGAGIGTLPVDSLQDARDRVRSIVDSD